jgi:Mlc titration factor MtfA (ptsG expression regulator)
MIQNEIQNIIRNKYSNVFEIKLKMLEVLYMAEQHLKKHLLSYTEIVFRVHDDASGTCGNNGKKISLQVNHAINSDMLDIENTILHEIAHALVGTENGHNNIWQEKAKELGVTFTINYRK